MMPFSILLIACRFGTGLYFFWLVELQDIQCSQLRCEKKRNQKKMKERDKERESERGRDRDRQRD